MFSLAALYRWWLMKYLIDSSVLFWLEHHGIISFRCTRCVLSFLDTIRAHIIYSCNNQTRCVILLCTFLVTMMNYWLVSQYIISVSVTVEPWEAYFLMWAFRSICNLFLKKHRIDEAKISLSGYLLKMYRPASCYHGMEDSYSCNLLI